jgi:hypothetical protein
MYSDQTGKFPAVSSEGNKFVMVLHDVNSNSSWAEPMKNQIGGELILACNRVFTRMRQQGINPKHQILNNQASESYKDAIRASGMTYQLVPPDNHRRNMAKKAIQTFKDHFTEYSAGALQPCPSIFGANSYLKLSGNYSYSDNCNYIQTYQHTHMSINNMTTINTHLSPISMEAMVHDKPHKR